MNPAQMVENRSTLLIFRDCIKLASRMVTQKQKAAAIRTLVRRQFERNKEIFDQDKIHGLKMNAVKGISNYIIHVVQSEYKLNRKKEINIMDEVQNAIEEEEDLQSQHINENTQQHHNHHSRTDQVV